MVYNLSNITGANDLYNIIYYTNAAVDYSLAMTFLLLLFVTIIIVFKKDNFRKSFMGASFVTSIVAVLMFIMQWIPTYLLTVPLIALFASSMIYIFNK